MILGNLMDSEGQSINRPTLFKGEN